MIRWARAQPAWFLWLLALGVLTRLSLGLALVPQAQSDWFVPFIEHFLRAPSLDPWQSFLDSGGDPASFPYGPVMLTYFAATGLITFWLPASWGTQLGIFLGLAALEAATVFLLSHRGGSRSRKIIALMAVSPIALYASFIHGQLDLLPTVLIFASFLACTRGRWGISGFLIGIAVAAKFSSALVAPLIIIFLWRNARYRSKLRLYLLGLVPGIALTVLPLALPGYRTMVIATPTSQSVLAYAIEIGPGLAVVVLPVVYSAILGLQYWQRRSNTDLLGVAITIMLTAVTLLTPASPGWYVWSLPFLALYAVRLGMRVVISLLAFWLVATVTLALRASGSTLRWLVPESAGESFREVGPSIYEWGAFGPILGTATLLFGTVLLCFLYRGATRAYDVYDLNSSPLSVAIAGDSGTGKDTLCASLSSAFGEGSTTFLMGDDYHRYARSSPLWRTMTHLHPGANNLSSLSGDAVKLMRGERIVSRHYDHTRGTFTKRDVVRRGDLVVMNGLHMLTSRQVREMADLTVFLSMDESLRRRFKIDRDVRERGQSIESVIGSIERRYVDVRRFVEPQENDADMTLHLQPTAPLPAEDKLLLRPASLTLTVCVTDGSFVNELHRMLVSLTNTFAQIEYDAKPGKVRLTVDADELRSQDIKAIATALIEHGGEVFVDEPVWLEGSRGLMQLVVVLGILEKRKRDSGI
jgi:uridine kinase